MLIDQRTADWSDPDVVRTTVGLALVLSVLLVMVAMPFDIEVRAYLSSAAVASEKWTLLSRLGKSDWLLIPSGVMLLLLFGLKRVSPDQFRRFEALFFTLMFLFVVIAGTGIVAVLAKYMLGVSRPSVGDLRVIRPFAFDSHYAAFPSGHATTAAAMAMAVTWLRPRLSLLIWVLAIAIAASRVVLAAHFLSDTLAGFLLGIWGTLFIADRFARRGILFERTTAGLPLPRFQRAATGDAGCAERAVGLRAFADRLTGRRHAAGRGSLAE